MSSCDYLGILLDSANTYPTNADSTMFADSLPAFDSSQLLTDIDTFVVDTSAVAILSPSTSVDTKNVNPAQLVDYAKKLIGVPYKYASSDPKEGFDCSGFITHVFNKFNIAVPRSSIDFTNVGTEVPADLAKSGDLILFTGTESDSSYTTRSVGHMGIVVDNSDSLRFIHSTSGKAYSVVITPLNDYYQKRFVKVIKVFP